MTSGMHNLEKDFKARSSAAGPEQHIRALIKHIGDDPDREGLLETPQRVIKSYQELFSGYQFVLSTGDEDHEKIGSMLKVFSETSDEMIVVRQIDFCSFCEHHMLPFTGHAHVAYIPNRGVVGLSKIPRIVDIYARRLQVQERLTRQIVDCLELHLQPLGAACVIEGFHSCMSCRGVRKREASMITSALTGAFLEEPSAKAEFLSLIK